MHIGAGEGDEEGAVASTLGCMAVVVDDDEAGELVEGIEREG